MSVSFFAFFATGWGTPWRGFFASHGMTRVGVAGVPWLPLGSLWWRPRPELNRNSRFRKPVLYPFELRGRAKSG